MNEEARSRAETLFARKEKQKIEGASATDDYVRGQEKQLANLARLRAQRLDRERPGNRKPLTRNLTPSTIRRRGEGP